MRATIATVVLLLVAATSFAVTPSPYQTGELVDFRVMGSGNGGPTCTLLAIAVRDVMVYANQCANFYWNNFNPAEFTVGGEVQVRFERNFLVVLRPNNKELKARISRRERNTEHVLVSVSEDRIMDSMQPGK